MVDIPEFPDTAAILERYQAPDRKAGAFSAKPLPDVAQMLRDHYGGVFPPEKRRYAEPHRDVLSGPSEVPISTTAPWRSSWFLDPALQKMVGSALGKVPDQAANLAMFLTGRPAMRNLAAAGRPAPHNFSEVAENMRLHGYKPQDIWDASVAYFKKHDPRFIGMFEGEALNSGERPWTVETEPPAVKPSDKTRATLGEHYDAPEAFAAHPGSENYTSIRREKKGFDYGPEGDQMRGPLWEAVAQENGRWAPGKKTMFNFGTKQPSAREVATHEFTHLDSPYPADVTKTIAANPAGKMSTADVLRLRDLMKYEEARAYAAEMRGGWSRGEREAIPAFKTVKEDYGPPDALDWLRAAKWAVPSALAASAAFSLPLSIMDERDKRQATRERGLKAFDEQMPSPPAYPPPLPSLESLSGHADDEGRHIWLERPKSE